MRHLLTIFILSTVFLSARDPVWGQVTDSLPPRDDMVGEIITRIERTKINTSIELVHKFESIWDAGGLTSGQKEKLKATYKAMNDKNLPVEPHLVMLLRMISFSGGNELIPLSILDQILDVTLQVIQNESSNAILTYFRNMNSFLTTKAIYYSNGYKLLVDNIDISFEYAGSPEPTVETLPEEIPQTENTGTWSDNSNLEQPADSWADQPQQPAGNDPWADDWGSNDSWADNTDAGTSDTENNSAAAGSSDPWGAPQPGAAQPVQENQLTVDAVVDESLPPERGPLIRFASADLIFQTHYDSVKLSGSKGAYLLIDGTYIGEGGKFDWSSCGLNREMVYCDLGKYGFKVERPRFSSVKSKLTYEDKIAEPVEGTFEYTSVRRRSGELSSFPRFTSYKSNIQTYFEADKNLIFKGGFSLVGNKIISKSLLRDNSELKVLNENGLFFRATGPVFVLSDSMIFSKNVKITLYQGRDSIFHPSVSIRYNPGSRNLMAKKDDGTFRLTPFKSTYFDMDIAADMIEWNLDADSIDIAISSARNIVPAYFESKDYFNKKDLKSLTGIYDFNPLLLTVYYARKTRQKEFSIYDLARNMKQNETEVKSAMTALLQNGFVDYDQATGWVKLKDKAFHYADANQSREDFDDLKIKSLSPSLPNATINLKENEMTIRGIDRFFISEILDVYILPEKKEITILRDRDLKFNGQLFAGNFEFIGHEFLMNYDSFYVDMNEIDSIRFYIDNLKTGEKERVGNKLVSADTSTQATVNGLTQEFDRSSGRLFINRPDNKSGQKMYPNYPRFNAEKGAVVYFDSPNVLDGAYDKSIYFVIPPFEIDSLSGSDPAAIGFDGVFVAEGILPSFDETLHIMDDNTLGFKHSIAPEGYQLYEGEGKIFNQLKLDHNGLSADGTIKYLTSTLESGQLTFFMDSLVGNGSTFVMESGPQSGGSFPDARVDNFRLKWLPGKDSMNVSNLGDPVTMYKNTASLDGTLTVSSSGGFGKGTLLTRGAEARSTLFNFNETKFGARHALFEIKSDNPGKPALAGDDIRLNFNLNDNYADIGPEIEGMAAINFPYAQFKTSISNARWNLNDRTVIMTKPDNVNIRNSYFYATRKELDSLSFNATKAVYDIDNLELLVSGIPYINVADAKITPENNEVLVLENARIGTLHNTSIVIDTLNEYHKLYNGDIDIVSRNKFEGDATYQFVNAVNDTFAIKIDEFALVPEEKKTRTPVLHTQAMGYIFEENGVVISPGMVYKGEAIMYAPDPAFKLNGYVKLQYRSNPQDTIWIKYQSNDTKTQEVKFDFEKARTENDEPLVAGLHYDDKDQLYATFVNHKKSVLNPDFFTPRGILSFDPDSSMYRIEDTLKVNGGSFAGRIFDLNVKTKNVKFEGPVNFNLLTSDFELNGSAIGSGNIEKNTYRMDAFLAMNFNLPPQAIMSVGRDVLEVVDVMGLPTAYGDDPSLLYKVSEIIGEKATEEYDQKSLQEYTPLISISPRLMKTIVLSNVTLNWSEKYKAWYSRGPIGIANILRDDINTLTEGFLEIKKTENGDVINLFVKFSPTSWYYFNFEENRMITASSNEEYINIVADKSNATKADFGDYFYLNGEMNDALRFITRFRTEYLGITDPYDLNYTPSVQKSLPGVQEQDGDNQGFAIPDEVEKKKEDDDGF